MLLDDGVGLSYLNVLSLKNLYSFSEFVALEFHIGNLLFEFAVVVILILKFSMQLILLVVKLTLKAMDILIVFDFKKLDLIILFFLKLADGLLL